MTTHAATLPPVLPHRLAPPVAATSTRQTPLDPRWFQIASLGSLLAYGLTRLGFDIPPLQVALGVGTALVTQWVCDRAFRTGASYRVGGWTIPFEPRSALISSLSLALLLRASHPAWAVLGAVLAVAPKFVLRVRGKHVLNPTNGAIVALLATGAPVWVSAAQWGHTATVAFAVACAGTLTVARSARADVTFAFLAFWSALLFGRAAWLGQPLATPLHQLSSGGLVLFAFFMISDPRTTPDSRAGRITFAALVALGAFAVQFGLWRTNGLLWSLVACSFLVPLLDRLLPGPRHHWSAVRTESAAAPLPGGSDALRP